MLPLSGLPRASPCPNQGRNGRGCSLPQTLGSLGTFPKPPSPGLVRKMTPQRLFHLMSTHVKEISTLSHSSGALDWDPPCSPPYSREAEPLGPGPGAPRLPPTPNFPQLQAHLSRREGGPALGGAREAAGASSCRGVPFALAAAGPTPRPGPPGPPPSSARPLGDPQPSGSPSRLSAEELRPGAGPRVGPGRNLLS